MWQCFSYDNGGQLKRFMKLEGEKTDSIKEQITTINLENIFKDSHVKT